MSSDLSIGSTTSSDSAHRASEAAPAAAVTSTTTANAAPATSTAGPGTPNPTLRLDPALGLVVIEFVSKSGAITSSIPSQRELTAYQDGTAEPPGHKQTTPAVQQNA